MFVVYILYSENTDTYYVGSTGNLADRLKYIMPVEARIPNEAYLGKLYTKKNILLKQKPIRLSYTLKLKKAESILRNC